MQIDKLNELMLSKSKFLRTVLTPRPLGLSTWDIKWEQRGCSHLRINLYHIQTPAQYQLL